MRARSVMRSKRHDALLRRDGPPHILETTTWAPWAGSLRRSIKTRASPGNVFRLVLYVVAINIWLLEFDGRSATGLSTVLLLAESATATTSSFESAAWVG
jgi:hypothetical protein